jgi:hypothetical protein
MVASFRFGWRLVYSICPAHHALVPTRKSAISPIVTRGPIYTSATDFAPIKQFQLRKFKGERWELFGDVITTEVGE